MSGQLVGEVLAASEELRARGLSQRGFHALVAIAEKAETHSRQGSVRWDHIRAGLYGASKRTAERAIEDLKNAGLVNVVKSGFNNNHGRAHAPIYEICGLTDTDTQVSRSVGGDTDTQVSVSVEGDTDKPGGRYRQNGDRYRHPGVVLDGSIDGPIDGGPPARHDEPRCRAHADPQRFPTPPKCIACKQVREQREQEHAMATQTEKDNHRARIAACDLCDRHGWRLDHGGRDGDRPLKCNHRGPVKHMAADQDFSEPRHPPGIGAGLLAEHGHTDSIPLLTGDVR